MRRDIFSGTFFLVISILATAEASASVMNSAPDVLGILFSVALWLMYASAKSGGEIRGARMGCGTAIALFVVNWVAVGLLAAAAAAVMFLPQAIYDNMGRIYYAFGSDAARTISGLLSRLISSAGGVAFVWMGLFLLVLAAALIVVNLFFGRWLMLFARSLKFSAEMDIWDVEKASPLSKWMFVLGILMSCGLILIFSDGMAAFQSGCAGAAMIVASRWLKYEVVPTCACETEQPQSEWYAPEE
jgi:hypothetical protein